MTAPRELPPTVPCRICGHPLRVEWQMPVREGRIGYYIVTCDVEACALWGFTFTLPGYHQRDLAPYMKGKSHAR